MHAAEALKDGATQLRLDRGVDTAGTDRRAGCRPGCGQSANQQGRARLSPLERTAFLLHDVFGQSMDEVAATIDRSPAATRQLAARARAHVQIDRPRYDMSRDDAETLARAFFAACKSGDAAALGAMLAEGASFHADGGRKVTSYPNVISGVENLIRLFQSWSRKFGAKMELVEPVIIDGLPGFVSRIDGHPQTTALQIETGRITAIYIPRNPDKLDDVIRH